MICLDFAPPLYFSSDSAALSIYCLDLCHGPDVTLVENQLLKFLHVWEGGWALGGKDGQDNGFDRDHSGVKY